MNIHVAPLPELPPQVSTIVMLGNRSSDHLRELARIAEWKGRLVYRIEKASELQPRWFSGVEEVGLVVGAVNLDAALREVIARLHSFSKAAARGMLEGMAQ